MVDSLGNNIGNLPDRAFEHHLLHPLPGLEDGAAAFDKALQIETAGSVFKYTPVVGRLVFVLFDRKRVTALAHPCPQICRASLT
jgi:hypothetical protein